MRYVLFLFFTHIYLAGGMCMKKEPEFEVVEHWKSDSEEERKENLRRILKLWRSMSREAAQEGEG